MSRIVRLLTVWTLGIIVVAVIGCQNRTAPHAPADARGKAPEKGGVNPQSSTKGSTGQAPGDWFTSSEFARLQAENTAASMRSGADAAISWKEARKNVQAQQGRDMQAARAGMKKEIHHQPTFLASTIAQAASPHHVWTVIWTSQAADEVDSETLRLAERAVLNQAAREGAAKALAQDAVGKGAAK